jgi:hypothetical protein
MNRYTKGAKVRLSAAFTDSNDTAVDPTAVVFKAKNPAGTVTTYTYGADAELVKDSTGNYHVDLDLDTSGQWIYRFAGTGTAKAADEEALEVRPSAF